jgi:hypothetical protein
MAEKRFYNMRINPVRPSYNDMNMVHQKFLEQNENVNDDVQPNNIVNEENDDPPFAQNIAPKVENWFDTNGDYIGINAKFRTRRTALRNQYLNYEKKPQKDTLKRFGLPDDFLENWRQKKIQHQLRFNRRNR